LANYREYLTRSILIKEPVLGRL